MILSIHTDMNKPTPVPTVTRRTVLSMCGTVSASTWRSGSEIVIAKPSMKLTARIKGIFFVFVSAVPILLPIGVIEVSAPREKRPIPATSITAPTKKQSNKSGFIGETEKHKTKTIITIGRTDSAASLIFSGIAVCSFSMYSSLLISITPCLNKNICCLKL